MHTYMFMNTIHVLLLTRDGGGFLRGSEQNSSDVVGAVRALSGILAKKKMIHITLRDKRKDIDTHYFSCPINGGI